MNTLRSILPLLVAVLAPATTAQDLHKALVATDAVLVARQVGKRAVNPELIVHRLQVLKAVRGVDAGTTAVSVLDWPNLALHQRPMPRQQRLYCLEDCSALAARLGLPAGEGPYFRMHGGGGTNPLVGAAVDADPAVRLAQVLAASQDGRTPAATAADLFDFALNGAPAVRGEAAALLVARADLRDHLAATQWSQLAGRATGELEDIAYKIALSELCAEQRVGGLLDGLIVSLGPVQDAEFARTVGRIATHLHGEAGAARFTERLQIARQPETRAMLLLALGASSTDAALQTLLQLKRSGADPAIEAALKEHRTVRAQDAVSTGR